MVANGPYISILKVDSDSATLDLITTIHAFQKPIMKISWDATHERIIAAGLDQHMKFFEVFSESDELQLRLQYKIKLPQAIMEFAISSDGQHFIIGLIDGSFLIKSKHLEEFQEEQDDETKMMLDAFKFEYKSKAKGYKYFYRGQYTAMPEPEDVISGMKSRK